MSKVARDIRAGLRDFTRRLKRGEPIEAVRLERFETPDGPMHVQTNGVLLPNGKFEPKPADAEGE